MNDFERQLSNQPLRQPPPEWRANILSDAARIVAPTWTWRHWFWPSPLAWGALAAVWVIVFMFDGSGGTSSTRSVAGRAPTPSATTPLYAFAPHRDLTALLDPPN